ncbi:hypothetical protein L249_8187 [Ophiocordyceps polyrhachis-furcata BCC 54312]|uniref:Uncharacterized protein n=1 Tax=Ophiocordyceps polyrhachis-furcata BCC 54312 TaxID=1330021 RepID=A0A367LHQ5_9HYPO|nr:hypothetical protein L249_8187 [Ophiocordyceps polyrhachis-furcata BCC 54312]
MPMFKYTPLPGSCDLFLRSRPDGLADASTTLSRVEMELLTASNRLRLLHHLVAFGENQLDVAGGASVKAFSIGVGLGVLEEIQQELGRLDGPSGLGNTELLALRDSGYQPMILLSHICSVKHSTHTLSAAAGAAGVSSHGDSLLVLLHILEKGQSAL